MEQDKLQYEAPSFLELELLTDALGLGLNDSPGGTQL